MSNLSPDFTLPINFCANPQDAWTIPARFYTDSQAFEHEKERIFANSWICVAHGSEVARPNDYITREIIGENIVIVRGRDNILRAFYNVCPHRGHQLLSGEGKAKKRDYLPLSRLGLQAGRQSRPRPQLRKTWRISIAKRQR
ncbi:Benzoate 1,2-dioxygenase [Klebsiella pneumoniae IS43]|uniref:Benzoate 1,2-dioxygenase n=1 Tax=Klebsiella pneumoniae IS43 TaxID=1432552 RepID=W1DGT0_KLEPN|nr:Benzoate 1,2-dioxygenase [Klebsiella pneumoniae IS43]